MLLTGGCHCAQVRFEVEVPETLTVSECNCSVCAKAGYLALIVAKDQFKLLSGEEAIRTYTFNTRTAQHHFCRHCGIKSFYVPRSHPDGVSVNYRCLDKASELAPIRKTFNGQEWEQQLPAGRADSFPNTIG